MKEATLHEVKYVSIGLGIFCWQEYYHPSTPPNRY